MSTTNHNKETFMHLVEQDPDNLGAILANPVTRDTYLAGLVDSVRLHQEKDAHYEPLANALGETLAALDELRLTVINLTAKAERAGRVSAKNRLVWKEARRIIEAEQAGLRG